MPTIFSRITLLLLFVSATHNGLQAHELRIARFDITTAEEGHSVRIAMDLENILLTLEAEYGPIDMSDTEFNGMVTSYLQQHFNLKINGAPAPYRLNTFELTNDLLVISGTLQVTSGTISIIDVHNTCMVDSIRGQSNIVCVQMDGKSRSFRLHQGRPSTTIHYQTNQGDEKN